MNATQKELEMSNNDAYNRARREKMEKYDCWTCRYFQSYCDPTKPCKVNKNIKQEDKKNG